MNALFLASIVWVGGLLSLPSPVWAQVEPPEARALPPTIPIFPLQDVALFPNTSVPLHIFEPRYRAMIADALEGDGIIGMVLLQPGHEADYHGRPPVHAIGCAGEITDAEELPDGRYLILLRGLVKFRVMSEDRSRTYRLAVVESLPEVLDESAREVLSLRRRQLAAMLAAQDPDAELLPESLSDTEFVDRLAQVIRLDPAARQSLLELDGFVERADALIGILAEREAVPL